MKVETIYINMKDQSGNVETIDEFASDQHATRAEFKDYVAKQLQEYKTAYKRHKIDVYTSSTATNDWLEK